MSVLNRGLRLLPLPTPYAKPWGVRFNIPDAAAATRTPGVAGNRRTFTLCFIAKQSFLEAITTILGTATVGDVIGFDNTAGYGLRVFADEGAGSSVITTSAHYDPTAPAQYVVGVDTTQATASNRIKIWKNGVQQTVSGTQPVLNYQFQINNTVQHAIGRRLVTSTQYYGGYLEEVTFIDALQLDATSFGSFVNGVWRQLKPYAGAYATNGYHLNFWPAKYGDAVTLANVLKDRSGNGNDWTGVNLNVTTPGVTLDYLKESFKSRVITDQGNYCTLNPLDMSQSLTDGNLFWADNGEHSGTSATAGSTLWIKSGKFRMQVDVINVGGAPVLKAGLSQFFVRGPSADLDLGLVAGSIAYAPTGHKIVNGVNSVYGAAFTTGDVIDVLGDYDAGTVEFFKNGASQGVISWSFGSGAQFAIGAVDTLGAQAYANFGQRAWAFSLSSDYKEVVTSKFARASVGVAASGYNITSGLGSAIEASVAALRPGWASYLEIFKDASNSQSWKWRFSDDLANMLSSDSTAAKTAFTAPTGADTYVGQVIRLGAAWGSFSSEVVHVNGIADNVAHGLGSARKMAFVKRSVGGTGDWFTFHADLTAGKLVYLNTAAAETTDASISVDATNVTIAAALPSGTYRVLVFAETSGLISLGTYLGNGDANGPYLYARMRPAMHTTKAKDSTSQWSLINKITSPSNPVATRYGVNVAAAPTSDCTVARLATGIKIKETTGGGFNTTSVNYIWITFAETYVVGASAV